MDHPPGLPSPGLPSPGLLSPGLFSPGQVEQALVLLEQALAILDDEDLSVAAAKVDEARWAVHRATGKVACLWRA